MHAHHIYVFLESIFYHNEENGFFVSKLQEKRKREFTTIVGNLPGINPGESLKLTGRWVHNRKLREQFQLRSLRLPHPLPFMESKSTLDIIEKKPGWFSEVERIGPKRIAMITKAWEEQKKTK